MQRERSFLDSFPETIDLNQGSFPNNNAMDQSSPWDNMLTPLENRLSNYMPEPRDRNSICTNSLAGFSGWDHGESSSRANDLKERSCSDDPNTMMDWSSSFSGYSGTDARSNDWSFQPSDISRPLPMQNYSSTRVSLNGSSNNRSVHENEYHIGLGIGLPHNLYKSGHSEPENLQMFHVSSSNIGSSGSSSRFMENNDANSSCKRRSIDGTSGQFHPYGSSSSNQPMANNTTSHNIPGCHPVPENLCIRNLSPDNQIDQRNGAGMNRVGSSFSASSTFPGISENSVGNFGIRPSLGNRDPIPYDTSRGVSLRNTGIYVGPHLSRPISNIDSSELGPSMVPPLNQPHFMQENEASGMHSNIWNGSFCSRGGRTSHSFLSSGERVSGTRDGANVRSSIRNNLEYLSSPETRNVLQDQIDWSFAPESSRHQSSASRIGQGSSGRSSSVSWLPHQSQTSQNHHTDSEAGSWIPFPRIESES